jgi:hypothetical protein
MSAAVFFAERFWLRRAERSAEASRCKAAWRGGGVSGGERGATLAAGGGAVLAAFLRLGKPFVRHGKTFL